MPPPDHDPTDAPTAATPAAAPGDPTTSFAAMMALEPHGPDTWVGAGPRYPWGGLYGGQIVAQALHAASATVDPSQRVHSLHAYFIRRGDHSEPVRYEVTRTRNGRSFTTRTVEARQAVGAILSLSASYQVDEDAPEVQTAELPDVPPPVEGASDSWSPFYERQLFPAEPTTGTAAAWMRLRPDPDVPDPDADPALHAAALAYLSDDVPTDAAHVLDPRARGGDDHELVAFSLDHAIWFHRPVRAGEWHLHSLRCQVLLSSRGLSVGQVFTADGIHVATVAQEVLLRPRR
jgi:acyl-CoA thioesterase-2